MPREIKSKKSKASGLGKGLENLMKVDSVDSVLPEKEIHELPISELVPNVDQPRKSFDDDSLATLAESIKNLGIFQPIVVRKQKNKYQIVAGERRYRAAMIAGLKTVPVIVKKYNTEEMTEVALVENLQREDLSSLEEAESYKNLMDKMELTQEELAKKLGKSRPYIANSLRLLKLPVEIKAELEKGIISAAHARTLLALKTKKAMLEVCNRVKERQMSVRELEEYINNLTKPKTTKKVKVKDIFIEEQENILKKRLGTAVTIKQNRNKKGKIEIEFKDNDEFERIIALFKD